MPEESLLPKPGTIVVDTPDGDVVVQGHRCDVKDGHLFVSMLTEGGSGEGLNIAAFAPGSWKYWTIRPPEKSA